MMTRHIVPILLWGSLLLAAALYLNATRPDMFTELRSIVQPTGVSQAPIDATQSEASRVARINALVISAKNKADLIAGRPYWGAAQFMVELAYNIPPNNTMVSVKNQDIFEFQTFTFNGKKTPVTFEFRNNQLVCAHYSATRQTHCATGFSSYFKEANSTYPYDLTPPQN